MPNITYLRGSQWKNREDVFFCDHIIGKKYSLSMLKLYWKSWFFRGDFTSDPLEPGWDFENPRGNAVLLQGIFKIPERAMGIWAKYPIKNTNFVHIFSPVSHQNNTITILRTFSKAYYFNIHCYMLRKKTLLKSKNLFYHIYIYIYVPSDL